MMRKLIASALAALLLASPAGAAVQANSFITPQTPNRGYTALTSTSALNAYQVIYTAGANGAKCNSIVATSTDSVGHNIAVRWQQAGNILFILTQLVGPAAGSPPITGGGPIVPFLTPGLTPGLPADQYGNQYIQLIPGDTLQAAVTFNAVSGGQAVTVLALCSDY